MNLSSKLALLALTLCSGSALAVNTFWTNASGDSRWNNSANWSPAHVPNSNDAVYIGANGPVTIGTNEIGVAASVSCTTDMNIIGNLYVTNTALLAGHTYMYGANAGIHATNIQINGQFEFFSGTLTRYTQTGTTNIASTGSMNVRAGANVSITTTLTVDGRIDINDATLSVLGEADFPIGFVASAGGVVSVNGNSTIRGNAFSYLASDGLVAMTGSNKAPTIAADMKFFNGPSAVLRVEGGAQASIYNPAQITTGVLNSGYWYIKDGSTLAIPDFRSISTIEGNGRVILEGTSAQFYNLSRLTTVSSGLSLRNGATLSTNPFGGTFTHQGSIELGAGSLLNIDGSLDCMPNAYTLTQLSGLTASDAGTIFAQNSAHLDGTLVAQFNDNFNPFQNTSVDLVTTGASGSGVNGAFTPVAAYPFSGQANMSYTTHTAKLTLSCRADLNSDGLVDDADFVLFVQGYNILDCNSPDMPFACPADLNNDTVVEDADFVLFAVAYNALLCD